MISRRTSSIPKEDVFPRLLYSDSRCSQTCHQRSQVLSGLSLALPVLSPAIPGAFKLVVSAPRLVAGVARCSQVHPMFSPALQGVPKPITSTSMVLLYQSSEIAVTLKAGRNSLLGSDTLLKLMHLSLH